MPFDGRWLTAQLGDLGSGRFKRFLGIGPEIGFVEIEQRVGDDAH